MKNVKLEYIWLDGYKEQALRSKTKVIDLVHSVGGIPQIDDLPEWTFDGSSTQQAEGNNSDCILKPVHIIRDPARDNGFLVMCEVRNPDGTSHVSNRRNDIDEYKDGEMWFGFEQEYVINNPETRRPLGFPRDGYPDPQGSYYCGVGNINVKARDFVEEHLNQCLDAGLNITGVNGEVMIGQWEYQLFSDKGAKTAADELWLSRYLLLRLGETAGLDVTFHPKPIIGDWNGSGMHTNFSSKKMREDKINPKIYEQFEKMHNNQIKSYGAYNELRLTGNHETQHIDEFSYGVSDRGASIRIPISTAMKNKGYLEDRRPASNANPYDVVDCVTYNVMTAETN